MHGGDLLIVGFSLNEPRPAYAAHEVSGRTLTKILFRYALNLPWVKYLQGYRIHRAAALLSEGRLNVTEAALEVGFDSLSHFNETFHLFMGVSPKGFVRK
jgi:AraC-like DNA-binding protein